MITKIKTNKKRKRLALLVGLAGLFFFIDLQTPKGVADGMLYIGVVMATLWISDRRSTLLAALIVTPLAIVGFIWSPSVELNEHVPIWNRLISLMAIWLTCLLVCKYKTISKRYRENQLRIITDNYPEGLLSIINRDHRYVQVSGHDPGLSAIVSSSLIGSLFIPLRYREYREFVESMLARGFEGEKIRFTYEDPQSGHAYQVNGVPLDSDDGHVNQLLIVSQDVTAIKKAERDMAVAFAKEKELNEIKARFITIASHEFRTPLGTILSSASLIGMYNDPGDAEKRGKHIRRISNSVAQLTQLLDTFLSIGRIESNSFFIKKETVELDPLIRDVVEELSFLYRPAHLIIVEPASSLIVLFSDRNMLRTILMSLLSNALKFSAPDSTVTLATGLSNHLVTLRVKDRGIGIPASEKQRIFETFFRASNAGHIGGIGLGLHVAKRYAELLGGTITFESEPGEYTIFEARVDSLASRESRVLGQIIPVDIG